MNTEVRPLSFLSTVRLLLRVARSRAAGRRERQQELMRTRKQSGTDWSKLGFLFTIFGMFAINGVAGYVVKLAIDAGNRYETEKSGKIVVSSYFLSDVTSAEQRLSETETGSARPIESLPYTREAKRIADEFGGKQEAIEQKLRNAVRDGGAKNLVTMEGVSSGLSGVGTAGPLAAMLGSSVLIWWFVMLVCQGEGLELDTQRRRNPIWEYLFAHPVKPGAVFLAEMLSPIAANPIYWGGPIFVGAVYGQVYGVEQGVLAGILVGVPVTIAAACTGKAIEIACMLRFPPRTRGAMIGFLSWLGYASMMIFLLGAFVIPMVVTALASFLQYIAVLPWPWLRLFVGGSTDGTFSYALGIVTCWFGSAALIGVSVWFCVWGTERGLAGAFGSDTSPAKTRNSGPSFGREPLYRKEFLWFIRDRSAIVQTILIPVTVAGFQVFNLRGLLNQAQGAWNYLCGVGILFGTYFLWVLGPKSLTSEGSALWIALTWPRGLESLLKAKAWLWSIISTVMVGLVLCYAAYEFPLKIGGIVLVALGWYLFSRSMAEKTVTLVTVTSSSGEPEQIPWGRRMAAQLGMLTFSIGVLTQQWSLAVVGIVYSYLTAAAMWQNFRARLPYLYDSWSEELPPAPTLMHAMVSISILVELGAIVSGLFIAIAGRENIAIAMAIGYAICAVAVSIGVMMFLAGRDVYWRDIWCWESKTPATRKRFGSTFTSLLQGTALGVVLGTIAIGYQILLQHLPATSELVRKSQEQFSKVPDLKVSFAFIAVLFAPFAEEYLFRGLLYRALDREWGGWRAVIGSAAFFAVYHPPLSWAPVALLGAVNAILFKKTGRLAPCVALHMVYNAVVLFH